MCSEDNSELNISCAQFVSTAVGNKVVVINMTYKTPACSVIIINKQIFLVVLGTDNERVIWEYFR